MIFTYWNKKIRRSVWRKFEFFGLWKRLLYFFAFLLLLFLGAWLFWCFRHLWIGSWSWTNVWSGIVWSWMSVWMSERPFRNAWMKIRFGLQLRNKGGGAKMCLDWGKLKSGKYQGPHVGLYWCHQLGGNQVTNQSLSVITYHYHFLVNLE